jgi:hypothetical protein
MCGWQLCAFTSDEEGIVSGYIDKKAEKQTLCPVASTRQDGSSICIVGV